MDPIQNQVQIKIKTSAKDFFLNIGAFVALYTVVVTLLNLLFTVINVAYPRVNDMYYGSYYYSSSTQNISWPVSILIIFFPILILLMWLLEKEYKAQPEKKNVGIHKWLSYITLFASGATIAGDLVTILYYFIDGQELTTGFLLKILSALVIAVALFVYYISDIRGKLNSTSRKIWRIIATLIVIGSIVWGFSVLGSPRTQRLLKYDEQKISALQGINSQIIYYFQRKQSLPNSLEQLNETYYKVPVDLQTGKAYEYRLIGQSAKAYELCAEFNLASRDPIPGGSSPYYPYAVDSIAYPYPGRGGDFHTHPAGHYCFSQSIDISLYPPIKPM
jgi:hypothetical protein